MQSAHDKLTLARHWLRADLASALHANHGLPDVEPLLRNLNEARKAAAYGDVNAPELDAEDIASQIEAYVLAVAELVENSDDAE